MFYDKKNWIQRKSAGICSVGKCWHRKFLRYLLLTSHPPPPPPPFPASSGVVIDGYFFGENFNVDCVLNLQIPRITVLSWIVYPVYTVKGLLKMTVVGKRVKHRRVSVDTVNAARWL